MTTRTPPDPRANEPDVAGGGSTRERFLTRNAETIGVQWSVALRASVKQERRPVADGFPGTLSEIRPHVDGILRRLLANARMSELTAGERERVTRLAYATARNDWLAHREAAEPDDG